MYKSNTQDIKSVISYLPEDIAAETQRLISELGDNLNEIRLRVGRPAAAMLPEGYRFIRENTPVSYEEIQQSFDRICGYSVYSHQSELSEGFITLPGGHRVGICGTACLDKDGKRTVKYISSINIRIATEHFGCSDKIIHSLFRDKIYGVLIAGPPCSGKTSLLKDFAWKLSSSPFRFKTVLVDERCELAPMYRGTPCGRLGDFCDVLSGYPKAEGIINAVRSLSPDLIICDEIGGRGDAEAVCDVINAGIVMISSVHACNADELYRRKPVRKLLKSGAFEKIIFLRGGGSRCQAETIVNVDEALFNGN